jgi:hypothetical protein
LQTAHRPWRLQLLVILIYILSALVLTWPLAAHFGTHVPGNGVDDPPLTWNLWWVRYALLDLGRNPFDCDYLFYPLGINLAFYTLTVLNGLLSIPVQAVLGLIPASNLLLLSSFVLSGYGAFLLSSYLLARRQASTPSGEDAARQVADLRPSQMLFAAFTAGLVYAFASSKLAYAALGQWNIASSQWIPFYVLCLFKMTDHPRQWRYPLMAALFLLFQAYAELTYASFLVLFTALWAVWQGLAHLRKRRFEEFSRFAANLAILGFLLAVGLAPMLAMMVPDMLVTRDILVEGGGFADVFSADLLGFLVPTMYHPIFGSLVERFSFDYSVGQHIYLGYTVLALAVVGSIRWWRRPEVRFWCLSAFVFWLLSLGPALRINGRSTDLPMPFALLARLPFFEGNRYPSRYSVLLMLSLAVLVAFGMVALQRRERCAKALSFLAPALLVLLLLFEHLCIPLPLSDMRVPAVYQAIADEVPGDSALLDLPVAWRNGFRVTGTQDPVIMFEQYDQSVHRKRLLAGNTSRNPPLKFQYFTEAPVINTLIALETSHEVDPWVVEHDRALATDVLRFFSVEAIAVHPAKTGPGVIPYVEAIMPVQRFYEDEETVAYRVDLPPWPEAWAIRPNDDLGRLSYAEGWGVPAGGVIWAQRRAAHLLVPLNGQGQKMVFRAYAPGEGQRLRVEVNGRIVARIDLVAGWKEYEIALPADLVHEGLNEVWLRFETLYPAERGKLSLRAMGQTGVGSPVNLVVQSAGQEVGDFATIYVDGRQISPNQRGYNVAVIDPQSGLVEGTAAFDTHLDAGAGHALVTFLQEVPPGTIVVVAAADEASRLLDQEAVDALHGIGAAGDLRGKFRWGHAIVGVQGAYPGTALEALGWMRPVTLAVGEGATEPSLAAAFATISFTAIPGP